MIQTVELKYPEWVREHLTPHLEVQTVSDPGTVELWLHPRQEDTSNLPVAREVYKAITIEGILKRSLSYGHLRFLEENPDRTPAIWHERGLWIYAWASVVHNEPGEFFVPALLCSDANGPRVRWLGFQFFGHYHKFWNHECAGLRAA